MALYKYCIIIIIIIGNSFATQSFTDTQRSWSQFQTDRHTE